MDDPDKEQEENKLNRQGYWTKLIQEFQAQLLEWLSKEPPSTEELDYLEDRELDALLLKVCPHQDYSNLDRTIPRTTHLAGFITGIPHRSTAPTYPSSSGIRIYN